jgi:hypothetical protein
MSVVFQPLHITQLINGMSHLAKNGLNFYAPILVETMTRLAGRVGPGVNVIPLLPVPVGGIGSETLIRDMMDLDSWIVSTGAGQAAGLPDSRDTFWRVVIEAGKGEKEGLHQLRPPVPAWRTQEPQDQTFHVRSLCGNNSGRNPPAETG